MKHTRLKRPQNRNSSNSGKASPASTSRNSRSDKSPTPRRERYEPNTSTNEASIAVSLKRIADLLEQAFAARSVAS